MPDDGIDLDGLLRRSATNPSDQVWVEGGWVDRSPSVPTDGGAAMITRFGARAWQRNLVLQRSAIEADHVLAQAETALRKLLDGGLGKEASIAFAAVQRARELVGTGL